MILSEIAADITTKLCGFISSVIWVIFTVMGRISVVTLWGEKVILSKVCKPILFKLGMMLACPNGTKSLLWNFLIGPFFELEKSIFNIFLGVNGSIFNRFSNFLCLISSPKSQLSFGTEFLKIRPRVPEIFAFKVTWVGLKLVLKLTKKIILEF